MSYFLTYDERGEILSSGEVADGEVDDQLFPIGGGVASHDALVDGRVYRYDRESSSVLLKIEVSCVLDKTTITANGIDSCILSDLPEGTELSVLGQTETETDGVIDFQTDLAGTYQLTLSHPLHLDTIVEIVAV